jgi:Na+/H+ antiporter NhaD/arsenite permease-like protein
MVITFIVLALRLSASDGYRLSRSYGHLCTARTVFYEGITVKEMVAGMTDSNVLMFLGMFIVGGCFLKSGLARTIGNQIAKVMKTEMSLIIGFNVFACVLSAVFEQHGHGCYADPDRYRYLRS